ETFWAGDHAAESRLKTLITESRLDVEQKYVDATTVANVAHIGIAANADWVVPAGRHERRFAVFNVSDAKIQDKQYFGAIVGELENGGYGALLHFLLTFDFRAKGIDPTTAPKTEGLLEQAQHSMDDVDALWLEHLQLGDLSPRGNKSPDDDEDGLLSWGHG